MKKQPICAMLSTMVLATAASVAVAESSFCGLYAGASVGGTFLSGHNNTIDTNYVAPNAGGTEYVYKSAFRKNSAIGTLFLGYGNAWDNCFYLGTEVFVDFSKRKANTSGFANNLQPFQNTLTFKNTLEVKSFGYGIDLRPGFMLSEDAMLYARVGVGMNKLLPTYSETKFGTPTVFIDANKKAKHKASLRLGVGIEQRIFDNLTLRADYTFTQHKKVNRTLSTVNNLTKVKLDSKAVSNTVMLGLSYYWQ